jgi:hypothetical protein
MGLKKFSLHFNVVPAAGAQVIPWDSTRGPEGIVYASIPGGSPLLAPGEKRGRFDGKVIRWTIRCTGNDVVYFEQNKTRNTGAAADWETRATGTATVTAGAAATEREWKTSAPDHRILVTAVALPTTIDIEITVMDAPS